MINSEAVVSIAVIGLIVSIGVGIPIAFSLLFITSAAVLHFWGPQGLLLLYSSVYGEGTNFLLLAIPLFIFMANMLKASGIANHLYDIIHKWFGNVPGGLAIGTVVMCAIFAAITGISSVATVTMGLISLPEMLKRGYNKTIAIGCINAGGALGILIPPSIIMVLYGAVSGASIGHLFMGGVIPGFILCGFYVLYIGIKCFFRPELGPPGKETYSIKEKVLALKAIALPILLIILVLGAMYFGIATPTEAAGIGALGAVVTSIVYKQFSWKELFKVARDSANLTCMIFWLIFGAQTFTSFLAYAGIQDMLQQYFLSLQVNKWIIMIFIQFVFFLLGMFLDPAGIILLTTPIFAPIVEKLGFDLVWFGILFTINMEMAYLTPPFGFNLFIMRGIAPSGVTMRDIYRSITPFVILQALCLALVMVFPEIALFLPKTMK
ncbi:MAG: TRAP transporter large permease subunit [Thermodesulforhabdaceae bacterium]